jgi:integrase
MEAPLKSQSVATTENLESCQDNAKTVSAGASRKRQVRSGPATASYWKGRLYRNTYVDRQGRRQAVSGLYVRMRHDGITKQVRLPFSERESAAEEAARLFLLLRDEGWGAIISRQERHPASPTVEEFCDHYRKATASMERPPREVSIRLYCRCLRQLCQLAGVKEIRHLSAQAVERARDVYRAEGRKQKRKDAAIQNTITKVIRNAKACFSREARAILVRSGLTLENPFEGIKLTQEIQPVFSLPADIVDGIWEDLPSLRDGAREVPEVRHSAKRAKLPKGRAEGPKVHFRGPNPSSYAAVLLALGCGLRANEIDKCRWQWFSFDSKGECFLTVKEEVDFKPKGGSARILRIPRAVYDALSEARVDLSSEYVLGGVGIQSHTIATGETYRHAEALRTANLWLRSRGIEADKRMGNPLHRLRKQFGSATATEHGLFAAQKLLGHSSPVVTAKYYAAQTQLPELTHIRLLG